MIKGQKSSFDYLLKGSMIVELYEKKSVNDMLVLDWKNEMTYVSRVTWYPR